MKLKEQITRLKGYMYDSSVDLKDRSFAIFTFVLIAELIFCAIPLGFIMHEPLSSAVSTFAGATLFGLYVFFEIKRKKTERAKIVVSILLIFVFLPAMFFTNGGVYSGVPVSMLLGGIYINMVLTGRFKILMNSLFSVVMVICWIVSYYHPELVTEYTSKCSSVCVISLSYKAVL